MLHSTHSFCCLPTGKWKLLSLQKPATLEDAIEHMVAVRLEAEKKIMSEEYSAREVSLCCHADFWPRVVLISSLAGKICTHIVCQVLS
jgi:hypothetical protein